MIQNGDELFRRFEWKIRGTQRYEQIEVRASVAVAVVACGKRHVAMAPHRTFLNAFTFGAKQRVRSERVGSGSGVHGGGSRL